MKMGEVNKHRTWHANRCHMTIVIYRTREDLQSYCALPASLTVPPPPLPLARPRTPIINCIHRAANALPHLHQPVPYSARPVQAMSPVMQDSSLRFGRPVQAMSPVMQDSSLRFGRPVQAMSPVMQESSLRSSRGAARAIEAAKML